MRTSLWWCVLDRQYPILLSGQQRRYTAVDTLAMHVRSCLTAALSCLLQVLVDPGTAYPIGVNPTATNDPPGVSMMVRFGQNCRMQSTGWQASKVVVRRQLSTNSMQQSSNRTRVLARHSLSHRPLLPT